MADTAPKQIGPYTVDREIGRGGMGVVFLAHDARLDRAVAIKALPDHLATDPERLARFEREARTLAQLNHPNVAGIHGFETFEGQKYLVLEYVEGETLAERLDRGPLHLDDALEIAAQIAMGVEAAHEAGVVHRDLKPANIKLTPEGGVKVLDFGLARSEESASSGSSHLSELTATSPMHGSPTMPGVILGTAAYMSPEQARGRRVDKRTDIWSFGVLVYEMLTGASPFVGETISDSIGAVLHKEVDLTRLPPDTPPGVRRVLTRCVERDKTRRYHHIADARLDLLAAENESESAEGSGPRRRGPVLVMAALLALAAFAAGWLGAGMLRPAPATNVGKFDVVIETAEAKLRDSEPRISPDGTRLVYVQDDQLWVRDLDSFESRPLPGTDNAVDPFWSPDGKWVGYHTKRAIHKVSLTGGDSIKLTDNPLSLTPVSGGCWTVDDRIVVADVERGLTQISARGGEPTSLLPISKDLVDYHDVSAVPGTSTLIYIIHRRNLTFAVGAFDGEKQVVIADLGDSFLSHPVYSPSGHVLFARGTKDRSIWAAAFDASRMEASGDPFLVERDGSQPSVSATGVLAFQRGGGALGAGGRLAWVTPQGDTEAIDAQFDSIFASRLSPDGSKLAFAAGEATKFDVWVRDFERGVNSRITFVEGFVAPIGWSPDGSEIAVGHFLPSEDSTGRTLFVRADGSGESRPAIEGMVLSIDAAWNVAAMVEDPASESGEVLAISLDDPSDRTVVDMLDLGFGSFALSPDGTLLAYTSDESGEDQVYCTRFPTGSGKWQVSTKGGRLPIWSSDATRLFFGAPGDTNLIYGVSLTREPSLQFGLPEVVIDGDALGFEINTAWTVSPDGTKFVILQPGEEESGVPASISVIQNWFEEHRDR